MSHQKKITNLDNSNIFNPGIFGLLSLFFGYSKGHAPIFDSQHRAPNPVREWLFEDIEWPICTLYLLILVEAFAQFPLWWNVVLETLATYDYGCRTKL